MLLLFQIVLSLDIAAVAAPRRALISVSLQPSFANIAPRYLKDCTSSSTSPLRTIVVDGLSVNDVTRILEFSVFEIIDYYLKLCI